ncbi:DUF262 domain-containing protein [Clostridium butyricum]|uniref:DUF262 domain-containing protein n=1 Tax=Clostridium butyricum TaxID=1492 RepID=UPI00090343EB|nr:DUF262 domain-containing protein [Clostridium butyricum]
MDIKKYEINPKVDSKTLSTIVEEIDKYYDKKPGGIEIKPEYQREYKFKPQDESLLIESFLLGIPIPSVYLSSDASNEFFYSKVIDGFHRLKAIYRFIKNEFKLVKLEKLIDLEDRSFKELPIYIQNILLYQRTLSIVVIPTQDDKSIELEIFKRYNKGTHPLSAQEIRHALYNSKANSWMNNILKDYYENEELSNLREIYHITKKRFVNKIVHENLAVILGIFTFGLNEEWTTSPEYAEHFMKYAYDNDENKEFSLENLQKEYNLFNEFLLYLRQEKNVEYPFSKELYGTKTHNYKLQVPILMIVSAFFNEVYNDNINNERKYITFDFIYMTLQLLKNSYLEDNFKGSSTRPKMLKDTLESLINEYKKL